MSNQKVLDYKGLICSVTRSVSKNTLSCENSTTHMRSKKTLKCSSTYLSSFKDFARFIFDFSNNLIF